MINDVIGGLRKCPHCDNHHSGVCSRVKAIEYHPDGTVRRVEYHDDRCYPPSPPIPVVVPPDLFPGVPYTLTATGGGWEWVAGDDGAAGAVVVSSN